MQDFIAQALYNELHSKIQQEVGNMRTIAFQVPDEMYQRIKEYLSRHSMTQKEFCLGLIGAELERDQQIYSDGSGRHDSITMSGSTWFDHKNQIGGGAIKFMQYFYNMDFPMTVSMAQRGGQANLRYSGLFPFCHLSLRNGVKVRIFRLCRVR